MKSKLFLSLSLLTVAFTSVHAIDADVLANRMAGGSVIQPNIFSRAVSTGFGYVKQTPSAVSTATSAMVSGYTVSKDFTVKHPLIVGGTITAAAIAFGGYKMYKNRVVAKAKADAEVTRKAQEAKDLKAKQDQETARIAAAKAVAAKVVKNPGYVLVTSRG